MGYDSRIHVQVKPHGRAGSHRGEWGIATFVGLSHDGEMVYRVIFGERGFEQSAKFRASDLHFAPAPSLRDYITQRDSS